ncbi:LysR family transcriptional regulator [uncultured Tateyamaria sp.]|uniref:LysR family transcriptional regulator n=1 Tax=uncultured Tateyamaria sp. TaxID=455651 RepID=UPI00260CC28A|nr:LysR family transcriptional regulator [uncultured Tateyamaria sp.]
MPSLDWSFVQSFAAVAEHGSLSAAARALGSSQPTLSRHIANLEEVIGTRLFDRGRGGMALTQAGHDLVAHATQMADAAARFELSRDGHDVDVHGTVRITASQIVACYLLPQVLPALRQAHPGIAIEVVASDLSENLLRREADIALRMYRPTQLDVISKHIGDTAIGAYAAHDYIARRGMPETVQDFAGHDLIGYDRSTLIIDGMRAAGLDVTRDSFAFRCDDQVVCWNMTLAGCGIGFGQFLMGDPDPRVKRVSGNAPVASLPIWLTAHAELRSSARVRRVYDWLAENLIQT